MDGKSKQILDRVFGYCQDYVGLTALYAINLEETKMHHKIINKLHDKESFLRYIKKIFFIMQEDEFEILTLDLDERIVCKKIDETNVIVFVSNKELPLGKIFTLLRGIQFHDGEDR